MGKEPNTARRGDDRLGHGRPFSFRKGSARIQHLKKVSQTRKEIRKAQRQNKKAKKHEFFLIKTGAKSAPVPEDPEKVRQRQKQKKKRREQKKVQLRQEKIRDHQSDSEDEEEEKFPPPPSASSIPVVSRDAAKLKVKEAELEKEMKEVRKKRLLEENEEEDRYINMLSKRLKLNKKAIVPASFREDGLDYLLELCDTGASKKKKVDNESNVNKNDPDEDDDVESGNESFASGNEDNIDCNPSDSEVGDEEADNNDEESENLDEDESSEEEDDDKEVSSSDSEIEKPTLKIEKSGVEHDGIWEDIYGRLRDSEGKVMDVSYNVEPYPVSSPAEVTKSDPSAKYVPPMRRENQTNRDKIKKSLKGLLNRLAESNMHSISHQIEDMYMRNSRNEMNESMLELFSEALVKPVLMPERIILEYVMLIAILHANVGNEVGAFFIQNFVETFHEMYSKTGSDEDKKLENLALLAAYMYHFKIVDSSLIYDLLNFLAERFTGKDVELILTILKNIGFRLRKDDPLSLKSLIQIVQQKATLSKSSNTSSRVKFMLEIILAIRNNNMNKIPNYDPSYGEHLSKTLKTHLHKGNYVSEMKISMQDLLNADKKGRWWIVGSAWSENLAGQSKRAQSDKAVEDSKEIIKDRESNQKLLEKAKTLGMNTDARRNIFCILMTAEDYLDAFEKLMKLGLKNQVERDIVHVIIYCCLQEKKFNPFYSFLAAKLCQTERRFMYPLAFKLEVAEFAKCIGQRKTSRLFDISQRRIFDWVSNCNKLYQEVSESLPCSNPSICTWTSNSEDSEVIMMACTPKSPKIPMEKQESFSKLAKRSIAQVLDVEIEESIHKWVKSQLPMIPSSTQIRDKAKELYREKGYNDFKGSYCWYTRWSKRFQISPGHQASDSALVEWLLQRFDNNCSVTHLDLQTFAKEYMKSRDPKFKASSGWSFRFFKRHNILLNWNGHYHLPLPNSLEIQVKKFLSKAEIIKYRNGNQESIGCMDEIPLSFTTTSTVTGETSSFITEGLRKGTVKDCEATVILAMLSTGQLLPPMIIVKSQNSSYLNQVYTKSDNPVIVFYSESCEPSEKSLGKWIDLIWMKNVKPNEPSLLLCDAYEIHIKLQDKCQKLGISLEIFPPGTACKLQPLNFAAKRIFLQGMREKWESYLERRNPELKMNFPSNNDIVDWVYSTFLDLKENEEELKKSFTVTGILP